MKTIDSTLTPAVRVPNKSRTSSATNFTRRPLSPVRASAIAPGVREVRLWELPRGAVGRCQLGGDDRIALSGVSGQCWVTLEGDRDDYLLQPGHTLAFRGPGRLVIEAIGGGAAVAVR